MNRILLLASAFIVLSSCVKEKLEVTYNRQEDQIDKYIASNMYVKYTEDDQTKTDTLEVVYNGGSSRLILEEGTGEKLTDKGTVSFYYAGYTFTGSKPSTSTLFTTNHQETAASWPLTDQDFSICTVDMRKEELVEGLKKGLVGVRSNEHCQILFSGKYAFGKKTLGIIPANSAVLFEIWVEAVSND